MKEERTPTQAVPEPQQPNRGDRQAAITPLGTPPAPPIRSREGDIIHTSPELAVGEGDVRTAEMGNVEVVAGTSLWKDAWKRLLKNKLAVFGLIVVSIIILVSLIGPPIIRATTGHTYDSIPRDPNLIKSFAPFTAPDGSFSWSHPMGTDISGRDILARVLLGGRISLMVGFIATIVSLIIGITYGATAGYLGGKVDDVMMRVVDVLYAIPYMMIVIVLLAMFGGQSPMGQLVLLFIALGAVSWLTMARIVRGQVISLKNQEFVLAARATKSSTSCPIADSPPNIASRTMTIIMYGIA